MWCRISSSNSIVQSLPSVRFNGSMSNRETTTAILLLSVSRYAMCVYTYIYIYCRCVCIYIFENVFIYIALDRLPLALTTPPARISEKLHPTSVNKKYQPQRLKYFPTFTMLHPYDPCMIYYTYIFTKIEVCQKQLWLFDYLNMPPQI